MEQGRDREVEQAPDVTVEAAPAAAATALAGLEAGGPMAATGPSGTLSPARVAALQRHAGNAAVSRLLGGTPRPPARSSAPQVVGRASILDDIAKADEAPASSAPVDAGAAAGPASAGPASGAASGGAAAAGPSSGGAAAAGPASGGATSTGAAPGGAAAAGPSSGGATSAGPAAFAGGGAAAGAIADLAAGAGGGAAAGAIADLAAGAGGGAAAAADLLTGAGATTVADVVSAASGEAKDGAAAAGGGASTGAAPDGGAPTAAVADGKTSGEAATALAEGAASPGAVGEVAAATSLTGGGVAAADLASDAASGSSAGAAGAAAASALVGGADLEAKGAAVAGGGAAPAGASEAKGAAAGGGAAAEAKGAAPGAGAAADAKGAAAGGGAGEAKAKSASGGAATEAKGAGGDGGDGKAAASGPATAAKEPSGGAAAPAELPKPNRDPHADPGFQAMKGRSKGAAGGAKAHTPAKAGAANAQGAAAPPSNDASSQAQAAQVDDMSTKEPGAFDREAFIAAVKEAIEKQAPKNLEEADEFKEGGADGVKTEVSGHVKKGKEGSEKDIKDSTNAPPDASKAKPKQVEPMVNDDIGAGEKTVGAQGAMPPPTPAAHTDLSAGPDSIDSKMADAEVTEEQLKKSNEPSFNEALGAKDEAKDHSDKAPGDFRKDEKGVLAKAKGDASGLESGGLSQMQGKRGQALNQAVGHKQGAKTADEAKRAKVANDIQGIYDRTKADVTKTLDGLDGKVDGAFAQGEGAARKKFEDYVGQRMDAYKEDRYGGLFGGAKWLKDKLFGMPDEVNAFYAEGKTRYLADMDGVIGKIADIVGTGLNAARARIAQGKAEIAKYVAALPQDLKKVGQEAEEKLESQFEQLESDIESKQSEMVDTLARKYVESRDALDARIDEMKAANKGLIDKAMDAIAGVIKTIIQLKNMLLNVLAKAAGVIGDIIADPIGFLGNLISGIKAGLSQFVGNIASHLQAGLMNWLTGALGGAGIELPKTFDIKGIFTLVLQVLGLTYANIRNRVVKQVGEPVVQKLEQSVEIFKVLITEGIGGLWRFVQDRLSDLYDTVIGGIKDFIIEKVIKAGITWLIAFMNPAAAFIKACKAIYDIIMFLIERGSEIMAFVNSVLDSIAAVAKGNIGAMAAKIEDSLAKALPLMISFLASLLGLGGISEKVRSLIQKVQAPINKAVDFVIQGAVKAAKKLFGKPAKWIKGKYDKGKAWAQDKVQKGKDWAKDKYDSLTGKGKGKGKDDAQETPDDVKRAAGDEVEKRAPGVMESEQALDDVVAGVRSEYRPKGLKDLQAVPREGAPGNYDILARTATNVGKARAFDPNGKDYYDPADPDIAADMAAAGIKSFGPYVWDSKVPRFKLDKSNVNPNFTTGFTQDDCVRRPVYDPEKFTVKDEKGAKAPLIGTRRTMAMTAVFGISRGVIEKLMDHDDGKTPRPFVSLAAEDSVSGGHSAERHVLGQGDMPTHREVALRAAFWKVNGKEMKLDHTGIASVFQDAGSADAAIRAWINAELIPNWPTHMRTLANNTQIQKGVAVGVPSVAYEKVDNPKSAAYPDALMPQYLDPGSSGKRELYRGDYKGDKSDPKAPDPNLPPLTAGGATVHSTVYVIIDPGPGYPEGWAIYTAYPKP